MVQRAHRTDLEFRLSSTRMTEDATEMMIPYASALDSCVAMCASEGPLSRLESEVAKDIELIKERETLLYAACCIPEAFQFKEN